MHVCGSRVRSCPGVVSVQVTERAKIIPVSRLIAIARFIILLTVALHFIGVFLVLSVGSLGTAHELAVHHVLDCF